jgi:hypothetical protein
MTAQAMCLAAARKVADDRPRAEAFIAAEGQEEHLGRGLLGIGQISKYGDQK